MKKKIILIISMLMVLAMIFTGCNKPKTDEPKENTAQDNGKEEISEEDKKNDEYVELVKKTKGVSDLIEGDIIAQYVKIAKAEEEADKLTLILSYTELASDKELAQEITSHSMSESFGDIMKDLYKKAEEAGLKDFTLDLDNVPGYPKDESLFLEEVTNEPKNTIVIVNKKDYEKAKKNEEKENWPHVEGLVYDKETKIAIKEIIDDFTK